MIKKQKNMPVKQKYCDDLQAVEKGYRVCKRRRVSDFQTNQGEMVDNYRALVYLILGIFGLNIVARALIQNDLNKYAYDS